MSTRTKQAMLATAGVVLALTGSPSQADGSIRRYEAVDLGFSGEARAVNDRGQMVGEGFLTSGAQGFHGFLWSAGDLTDLGVLQPGPGEYGRATDLNNRGQIVGFSVVRADPEQSAAHAFMWQRGALTDIDPTSLDNTETAVNNRGQVVGTRYTAGGPRAFLWQGGTLTELGTGYARDINDRGQVVGLGTPGGSGATMWFHGRKYDLGAPTGYEDWSPVTINERGWIAGNAGSEVGRAILWRSGSFVDLGTLGGPSAFVIDLNDRGQVLGLSETAAGGLHPFLWQGGVMKDLTAAGIPDYVTVNALGNRGQIVGTVGGPFDQHAGFYR